MAIIKPPTLEEFKEILTKITLSRTSNVTKVSQGSTLNGFFYGMGKTAQKIAKDVAISSARYYPDDSYGDYLDEIAGIIGVNTREAATGSTGYVRLHGTVGVSYLVANSVSFSGTHGIVFDLQEDVTIPDEGFVYAKVAATTTGSNTNVDPHTVSTITNAPANHDYVTNDFQMIGGRDLESDEEYRQRIKEAFNVVAAGTQARLDTIFNLINPRVLRTINYGATSDGKFQLGVIAVDGGTFSTAEFDTLLDNSKNFLSLTEQNLDALDNTGMELVNVTYYNVDVSLRAEINGAYSVDEVRKSMQVKMNQELDYRYWKRGDRVEWDNLLQIAKETEGVTYVDDSTFVPAADIEIPWPQLPRIRGFELRDIDGNILFSESSSLDPVYYPPELDFNLISNALKTVI